MTRTIAVFALLLVLPIVICSQATTAVLEDPKIVGDDHPWGGEEGDDSQYRRTVGQPSLLVSTGYVPVDLLLSTSVLYNDIFVSPKKTDVKKDYLERDLYSDNVRKVSFK